MFLAHRLRREAKGIIADMRIKKVETTIGILGLFTGIIEKIMETTIRNQAKSKDFQRDP